MASAKEPNAQCHHSGKYEIRTDGGPVPELPYPSRLGFLHITERGTAIRYIDLNKKLCRSCCDSLVADGKYLVWSVLAGTSAANVAATMAALLPGDGHFPPILQAGSELKDTSHNVVLPIPDVPGAKEAWKWLEKQAKPFYIDQLHMVVGRGMSPLARRRAAKDSAVALRYGQVFNLDVLRSSSTTSTIQVAVDVPDTHETVDPASPVKKKSTSKKDPAKKRLDETSKKEEKEKEKEKKDKKEKKEKKKKTEKKEENGKKEEKEEKEKQAAQVAEIITSSATYSTKTQVSEPSTVRPESKGLDSNVFNKSSKTLSTSSLDVLGPTLGPPSTPNFATASISSEANVLVGGAPSASKNSSGRDGASVDVNATQVVTTTVKTLSRSWGWSEPFEFTTGHRRVPALSDYERVAESRAPSYFTANSLDNFLRERLQLDAPRKLLGPGEAEPISHKATAGALSSMLKDSKALQHSESKVSGTKTHDSVSSAKKASNDSNAKSKPKKPTHDSLHSDASGIDKGTNGENTEKSTGSKKTGHLGSTHSSKLARGTTSEQSKQQVRKDASSTSSHRANKKAVSSHLSTHRTKSETRTKEVLESSIKVKRTSDQPGSVAGVFKAGMNCLENKLHEATEKKHKKDKHQEEKPSKPGGKPHEHPDHETDGHSENSGTKPTAQSETHPLQPGQKPPGKPEQEPQGHSEGNGPNPSTQTGANPPQSNDPGLPDSDHPSNVPTQDAHPDQTGPPIQTTPSAQTEPPVTIATSDFTQLDQSAGTDGMAGPGSSAQINLSQQASAQGGSDLEPSTQLPSQAGGGPISYQPVNVSMNSAASSMAVAGEAPVQNSTGQQDAVPSNQGTTTSPTPPTGLGIMGPGNQPMRLPDNSGGNHHAIGSPAEAMPLPTQSNAHITSEGPSGGGSTSTRPAQGYTQTSDATSVVSKPENLETPATSGFTIPQSPGVQVLPGAVTATTGLKPLDLTANSQPEAQKEPSSYSPVKSSVTGPGTGMGLYDHTMAQEPKRTGSKKPGGHIAHDIPSKGSGTIKPKLKPEHTPKRPQAVAGGKKRPSGLAAAGVVAGVAVGAAAVAIAGQADVDEGSSSDSDNDTTHAGASDDDDGTGSESSDGAEAPSDRNDSSDDETHDDDEEGQVESESDGDEDQGFETSDSASDDDSGPEHAEDSDGVNSDNEDEGEDASIGSNSSEGENFDEASDDEEEEAENAESDGETSGNGSDSSDNDTPAQESSDSEDSSDGDDDESSSEGEDNDGDQEDDEEEPEQDASSDEGSSDHDDDDDEVSDNQDYSDED